MLESVRALCAERDVPAQLALEAGMACGFGACYGCVVPRLAERLLRVCVDGRLWTRAEIESVSCDTRAGAQGISVEFCGIELAHPVVNGSGTFDAIAARRAFGKALDEEFPFAAFVSKTITLAPRLGNPPPRLWKAQAGLVNSIGLPNKGLERYVTEDLPELARLPVPLFTNVMGSTAEEIATLLQACDARPEIAAVELNVSCPNVQTVLTSAPTRLRSSVCCTPSEQSCTSR